MWLDIASIAFVCVTMNHLGLIREIEHFLGKRLIILNCPKCVVFWTTLLYQLCGIGSFYWELPVVLAISFLTSYLALWLELLEGFIDTLYLKLYETIYPNDTADTPAADTDDGDTAGSVPDLRQITSK